MKSRQVGYVLIALILIGVAGLVVRVVSASSNELTLEGVLPVTPDVIDRVTITSPDSQAELVKRGDVWQIDRDQAFGPKLDSLWSSVAEINGAQLIATNPENHGRMGVAEDQGTRVAFWLGDFMQEEFIVGKWTPDVRLCYLREPGRAEVYAVPCPATNIFDANPDGWRNPVVASIPRDAIESITFTYPDGEFVLRRGDRGWINPVVDNRTQTQPADVFVVGAVLGNIEGLVSSGFATPEEAQGLNFVGPEGISVRVATNPETNVPTTRVRFLPKGDGSYYATTATQPTVFIVGNQVASTLLLRMEDFITQN